MDKEMFTGCGNVSVKIFGSFEEDFFYFWVDD